MIFSLLLGVILGAVTVLFALQNVTLITVTFLTWQISAPLAFVLLSTLASGVIVTLLMLIPSLVRDDIYLRSLKKQKREIEDEFAAFRSSHPEVIVKHIPEKTVEERNLVM